MTQTLQPGGLQSGLDVFVAVTALDRWLAAEAALAWARLRASSLQASFTADVLPSLLPKVVAVQRLAAEFGATGVRQQAVKLVSAPASRPVVVPQAPARVPSVPTIQVLPSAPPVVTVPSLPADSPVAQAVRKVIEAPKVTPAAFAGVASDGRPLASLLAQPLIETYTQLGAGVPTDLALSRGMDSMDRILATQVHDAAREAGQVQMTAIREITGYQRLVEPGACDRCAILAGRIYRYNASFLRHPACRCVGVPVTDATAPPRNDRELFDAMSVAQQNRSFGLAGAQAIRDGASPQRVVNARRGMSTVQTASGRNVAAPQRLYGQDLLTTTAGARPGRPRLMPAGIYQIAGDDRGLAIDLLQTHGYLST